MVADMAEICINLSIAKLQRFHVLRFLDFKTCKIFIFLHSFKEPFLRQKTLRGIWILSRLIVNYNIQKALAGRDLWGQAPPSSPSFTPHYCWWDQTLLALGSGAAHCVWFALPTHVKHTHTSSPMLPGLSPTKVLRHSPGTELLKSRAEPSNPILHLGRTYNFKSTVLRRGIYPQETHIPVREIKCSGCPKQPWKLKYGLGGAR